MISTILPGQFGRWQQLLGQDAAPAFSRSRRLLWSAPRCSFAGEHAAGDRDVFATGLLGHVDSLRQGTLLTHLRQLDQHGTIDSCEHVHFWTAHAGNSNVRWGVAEHVGENGKAVTAIDAIDGFDDVASAQITVVLGCDREGFDFVFADPSHVRAPP